MEGISGGFLCTAYDADNFSFYYGSFVAGDFGFLHLNTMQLYDWTTKSIVAHVDAPEDTSLFVNEFGGVGGALLWNTGNLEVSRQKIWTAAAGTASLLTAGDDALHGYADLGTDGVDMIWSAGERTPADGDVYPRLAITTSKYATTSAGLVPRVLRTDVTGYGFRTTPWVVGCGYAARASFLEPTPGDFKGATIVVRLTDGFAWFLSDAITESIGWRRPLAITCDELFALVDFVPTPGGPANFNIARLPLSALGTPIPP